MAQKSSKKSNINIDDEKDPFLNSILKKVRNNNKKLDQIKELRAKDKSTLKPEQLEKISSENEIKEKNKYFNEIRTMYLEALKSAKEESKSETNETINEVAIQETRTQVAEPQVVQTISIKDTTLRILNLVHFAQLYTDPKKRDELRSQFDKADLPDFDTVYEFYAKIFTFSESDRFDELGTKINNANKELESYLIEDNKVALRNQSYKTIAVAVERIASSGHFKNLKADISSTKINTSSQISAIGSELKKEAPVEEIRAPEPKAESPVKVQEKEIPTVEEVERQQQEAQKQQQETQKQQQPQSNENQRHHNQHHQQHHGNQHHHNKHNQNHHQKSHKDWADFDDEKEETKNEATGAAQEEEDDGWNTVKARDKKAAPVPRGRGSGRGRGRGNGGRNGGPGRQHHENNGNKEEGGKREYKPKKDNREHAQYVVKNPEKQNQNEGESKAQ